MLIIGHANTDKTDFLENKLVELITSGISSSEILVLCSNSYKRHKFVANIREKLLNTSVQSLESPKITTFSALARNTILNNWAIIEKMISETDENSQIIPDLTGLDILQYFLKDIIQEVDFSDYFSKTNLLYQLFRRYRLISENKLSKKEIAKKSAVLKETFAETAEETLKLLKEETTKYRVFDPQKQINIFLYLIENNFINDFDNIKYLIVDDLDEFTYSAVTFVKYILSNAKDAYLACDEEGSSRRGYLSAYTEGVNEIKLEFPREVKVLPSKTKLSEDAQNLLDNIKHQKRNILKNFSISNDVKQLDMLNNVFAKIKELVKNGVSPSEIIIATPVSEESLAYCLKDFFEQNNIEYQFLYGNKRIFDNIYVYSSLMILELINNDWKIFPSEFEIRILLNTLLDIPMTQCKEIIGAYIKTKSLPDIETGFANYKNLILNIEELKKQPKSLSEQFVQIFSTIILPNINKNFDFNSLNLTLKSLEEFEKLSSKMKKIKGKGLNPKDWILHIKNSVVADTPSHPEEVAKNAVIIGTPQKIVDFEITSKYQIWLDVSSREWIKEDTGRIYNAWVFQKNWQNKEYTKEVHEQMTLEKTAHLLRKLTLCGTKEIFAFSSALDTVGNENVGKLPDFIEIVNNEEPVFLTITPREDQKPVLDYTKGKMAVPAVPGAGKTTIMLALIIELLKKRVPPKNILVLTYMESAARNFLERIKKSCPTLRDLPHISTIHALAYKILLDSDNFTKAGLEDGFSICDDTQRPTILREICLNNLPVGEDNPDAWIELNTRGISLCKTSDFSYKDLERICKINKDSHLSEFLTIYRTYEQTLKEKNLIDYDDLLTLSVKLLREHQDIKEAYQRQFEYVIEDEAQDSSEIQQELITILSEKSRNLIRCGDINQAITGTFTQSDVEGFKKFINENHKVEMTSSQRSCKDIYEFANSLVDYSKENQLFKNAFYDLKMKGTGENPKSKNALNFKILNNPDMEKIWVKDEIKRLYQENPNQTFGVLLRQNSQVYEWAKFIEDQDLKVICRLDSLKQKKVFKFITTLLEVVVSPWDNKQVNKLYEEYLANELIVKNETIENNLKKEPFINSELIINTEDEDVAKFWWDIHFWLENSNIPPEELVIKMGNYYFDDVLDRSNAYLLAILIKRYLKNLDNSDNFTIIKLPEILQYLKSLLKQNKISGIKLFEEVNESNTLDGFIQVMTVHKSKGDEFDNVFIPEFYESYYSLNFEHLKEKNKKRTKPLLKKLSQIITKKPKFPDDEVKKELEETLRLIYVAITRAKQKLYLTAAEKNDNRKWDKIGSEPSMILKYFIEKEKGEKNE